MRQIIQLFNGEAEKLKRELSITNEQWNDAVQQNLYDNFCYPMVERTQNFTIEILGHITETEQQESILYQIIDKYNMY